MTDDELWQVYAATRDRFAALALSLDPAALGSTVPSTPEWTVADNLAHVCGLNADLAAGMRTGLGTPDNTQRQVASRRHRSVAEVCDEWTGHETAVRAVFAEHPDLGRRIIGDLAVHLNDVEEALGVQPDPSTAAVQVGAVAYAANLGDRVASELGLALAVETPDGNLLTSPSTTGASLTLRVTAYDFLRSVTGRRTRDQVAGLDWSDDPTQVLDIMCPYGPLPTAPCE